MSSKKSFFTFIRNNRRKAAGLMMLVICLGVYTAIGGISSDKTASEDIPIHDGDVLVDSLSEIGNAAVTMAVILAAAAMMFLVFITVLMGIGGGSLWK